MRVVAPDLDLRRAAEGQGVEVLITSRPEEVYAAERVVLPGVGAFRDCMHNLEQGGFIEPIRRVIAAGRPFLGICVGMQMLFSDSVEFGFHPGLGIIPGHVLRFPDRMTQAGENLKVPQMGWNQLRFKSRPPALEGVADGSNVYFVHSYYVKPDDDDVIATTTDYGLEFCSSVWKDNIIATQFHPEKSQDVGLRILKNFAEMK